MTRDHAVATRNHNRTSRNHRLRVPLRLETLAWWTETTVATPVATRNHPWSTHSMTRDHACESGCDSRPHFWALVSGPDLWTSVLLLMSYLGLLSRAQLFGLWTCDWLLPVNCELLLIIRDFHACWTFVHYLVRIWLYVISVLGRYWLLATWLTFCD